MPGNNVNVRLGVSGVGKASSDLDNFRDKFDRLQKQGLKGFGIGVGAAVTAKGFAILDSAISGTIGVMADASRAAMEEEESIARLDAALAANVKGYDGNTAAIEKTIASRMRLGFSDDEQRESLALLTVATKDSAKALDLERAAMDLARLKRISLADASSALIKIEGGQFRALKALGIELKEGATQTEALAAVQAAAAGQAERYASTLSGEVLAAQIRVDEAMEKLGQTTAPLMADGMTAIAEAAETVVPVLQDMSEGLGYVVDSFGDVIDAFIITDGKTRDYDKSNVHLEGRLRDTGRAAEDLDGSLDGATSATYDAQKAAEDLEGALEDLTEAAYDAVDAFGDQAYSSDELKGRLAELEEQLGESKRELLELEAIKNPTAAQQRDIIIATGKVAGYRHDIFDTRVELAKLDGTGLDALMAELSRAAGRTDALGDEAREALSYFQKLSYAAGKVTGSNVDPGYAPRADGGPVSANKTYIVGEEGPELFVPNSSGKIIPNGGMGSPGGWGGRSGGVTLNVYPTVNGMATPAAMAALQAELMPTILDGLRRAGVI